MKEKETVPTPTIIYYMPFVGCITLKAMYETMVVQKFKHNEHTLKIMSQTFMQLWM